MARLGRKTLIQALKPYTLDYTKEFHLRELAREIDIDHTSLRPHLNSLKEKGVIEERKQGRNKVFSLKQSSDLLPYYLAQAEADRTAEYLEKNNTIRAFWKNFRDKLNDNTSFKIETLVLFGSFAKHAQNKKSDIDLFLAAPQEALTHIMDICKDLENIIGRTIEIENTDNLRNLVGHKSPGTFGEIVNNHIILLGIEKFVRIARWFQGV